MQLFVSYNSVDRPLIVAVQRLLEARGITTFLDRDQLVPGLPWPVALEEGLRGAGAVGVFIGRELGGWQKREMWFALDRQVREEKQGRPFPVIPVLLPGADLTPGFLFSNTWIDLRSGVEGIAEAESLDAFERAINSRAAAPAATERASALCPYRGLEAFREEDVVFFAGRSAFASQLLNFTLGKDLVVVVGSSGSGKSSVVQAGLVPLLRRQLPPAATWDAVSFTPGSEPFHRLALALIPLLEPEKDKVQSLAKAEELGANLSGCRTRIESVIDAVIKESKGTGRLLLIADQFEELFTLTPDPIRRSFAQALLSALGKARFTLLITLRADFYSQIITLHRGLSDRLAPAQVNIGALTREELRESVTAPAELVGLKFEPGLVDRILDDVGAEPGNLPLLEFSLTGLWSRRQNRTLSNAAYNAIGGVTGALAQRAEAEFERFTPAEQAAARRLFSRLVRVARPEEGAEDTRQQLNLETADAVTSKIALTLAGPEVRLLVMGRDDQNRCQTVEVAHEALIRNWERLRSWVNEDREFLLWRQRLQVALEGCELSHHDPGSLLRGLPLVEAEHWVARRTQDLSNEERRFVAESIALREREAEENEQRKRDEVARAQRHAAHQARQLKILHRLSIAMAILLLLAITAIVVALRQRSAAQASAAQSRASTARQLVATSMLAEAADPELSVLIAAQALASSYASGHTVTLEEEQQLHHAVIASRLRLSLRGHNGEVQSVAWSPDGKRLATGSEDKTAKVWDAETGKELLTLSGHTGSIASVAWSPDGRHIATRSEDSTAKVWDAATDKEVLTLSSSGDGCYGVGSVAWSPDSKRLATGCDGVTMWDAETGKKLATLRTECNEIISVAWSRDGKRLASGGCGGITVWDAETGKKLRVYGTVCG